MSQGGPKANGTVGPQVREPAGSAEMRTFSQERVGQKCTNRPVRPKWEISALCQMGQRGVGMRIAEGAESQSDHTTCHWQKRDMEAHFGRFGRIFPAQHWGIWDKGMHGMRKAEMAEDRGEKSTF
ncbi:hypothetical protein KI387_043754, partial [Taxus chinensis]